jgi:aminoglycoside/choline kinase family phosphotransferase/dTDP-glucose pyrophosphorylase
MKALILAAGFGTRLRPHTEVLPKPLFPIGGRTILDTTIEALIAAGCTGIVVNTHHLGEMIAAHIRSGHYAVPVITRDEPEILDTGGAIRNVADLLGDQPFFVVNGDIVTDVDYAAVYRFHTDHPHPVTLVLHDCPEFNCVTTDQKGFVRGFYLDTKPEGCLPDLAFTGIQVVDPSVIGRIPPDGPYSSLALYRELIARGPQVKALILDHPYWIDMGTPQKYLDACRDRTAPTVFDRAFGPDPNQPIRVSPLAGDGSDRIYRRLSRGTHSLVVCDHGITMNAPRTETAAFVHIGRHLERKGIPVPRIHEADLFSGQVYLEDLGNVHLAQVVRAATPQIRLTLYRDVLQILARMSVHGAEGFDRTWTWQSTDYDRDLIIEREGRYFVSAFVNGVLGLNLPIDALDEASHALADRGLAHGTIGFMHRDFQSRNIMVHEGRCRIIDFQGGRMGPVQYDLASLLIDPYADIDPDTQNRLLDDYLDIHAALVPLDRSAFRDSYRYLRICRNLQMLGAFGFLSRVRKKPGFADFIPTALGTLIRNTDDLSGPAFGEFKKIMEKIRSLGYCQAHIDPHQHKDTP